MVQANVVTAMPPEAGAAVTVTVRGRRPGGPGDQPGGGDHQACGTPVAR
jgi:hypothetical protein